MEQISIGDQTMEEQTIWKGSPSQWTNFTFYLICFPLAAAFGLGILLALWKYYDTKFNMLEVTNQRIVEHRGIFSKTTDEIELFRVKDIKHDQPFFLRLLGLSNIILDSTDRSSEIFTIAGIESGTEMKEKLREAIDIRRDLKGVRELDFNQ